MGSVGKTSIAKALQQLLDEPYLHIGMDHFIDMLPKQYLSKGKKASEGLSFNFSTSSGVTIALGPVGRNLFASMRQAMLSLVRSGFNLIIDDVVIGDEWQEYRTLFQSFRFITVGVFAPLAIIEERERIRGDRTVGLAKAYFDLVHKGKSYDFEIDSSIQSPTECAQKIALFMKKSCETPEFFEQPKQKRTLAEE